MAEELQDFYYNEHKDKPSPEQLEATKPDLPLYIIRPCWLTMICGHGVCQLCKIPEGNTHTYTLNYKCYNGDDKRGFIVCGKPECNLYIKTYIKILYHRLYITKKWQELLVKRANNSFVSVTRSNGSIEHDWILCSNETKTTSVCDVVMTLILCCKKQNIFLPSELFEYIYNRLVYLYNDDIHLIFDFVKNYNNNLCMNILLKCFKGDICKNIPIELL